MNHYLKTTASHAALLMALLPACGSQHVDGAATFATVSGALSEVESTETGNGTPKRYELILASTAQDPHASGPSNRLTVPPNHKTQIYTRFLGDGDLQIIDGNGADGFAAFGLPKYQNGVKNRGYAVAVRVPGEDGREASDGCIADRAGGELFCGIHPEAVGAGNVIIHDVSRDLLTVDVDLDGDGLIERVPMFDPSLEGISWEYAPSGEKIATIGFFPLTPR